MLVSTFPNQKRKTKQKAWNSMSKRKVENCKLKCQKENKKHTRKLKLMNGKGKNKARNRFMWMWLISLKCFNVTQNLSNCEKRLTFVFVFRRHTRAFLDLNKWKLSKLSVISKGIHVTLFRTYFDLGSACTKCFQIWIEWISNAENNVNLTFFCSDWNLF